MGQLLQIGIPVALQDGFIQIAFIVITIIANRRGLSAAAAVGIVEKMISFLFLVPSSMLSTYRRFAPRILVQAKRTGQERPFAMLS